MADVFLSYAREDRSHADDLAKQLFEQGWDVFYDRGIEPGTNWDNRLQYELLSSDCVVVLWSAASVQSSWVKHEANIGLIRKVLLPVQLDDSEPPPEFRQLQTVDFKEIKVPGVDMSLRSFPIWLSYGIMRLAGFIPPSLMREDPRPELVASDLRVYSDVRLLFHLPFERPFYSALARVTAKILAGDDQRPDKTLRNLHRAAQA